MKFFDQKKLSNRTKEEKPLSRRTIVEVSLTILVIFLSSLLFFGISVGKIDAKTVMISLLLTYIILQYWLGRVIRAKQPQNSALKK